MYSSTPSTGVTEGRWSSFAGQVVGSRPPGSAAPSSTSASALPASWPGNHTSSVAGTSSSHGISTGAPALTTAIVRGWTSATRRTSSSWRPGSASDVAVEALALDLRRGADHDDRDVGIAGQRDRLLERVRVVRRLDVDLEVGLHGVDRARDDQLDRLARGQRHRHRVLGRREDRRAGVAAVRQRELERERLLAVDGEPVAADAGDADPVLAGAPRPRACRGTRSPRRRSSAPSASARRARRRSLRRLRRLRRGSARRSRGRRAGAACARRRRARSRRRRPGSAARRPSSGETVYSGNTVALPPPSVRANAPLGPITATRRSDPAVSGSSEP